MKKIDYRKLCHPAHPEFRLATSPFYLMAHADFDYHEDMSTVLEKLDVDRSMYRIMTVLREHESANIGFLAQRSLIKPNTASRVIERMVAKELARSFPNPDDSRVTEVVLTQHGKDLLNSLTPIVGRQFQRAIDGVSNEDLEHLVRVLQRISNNLNRLPIETPGESPAKKRVGSARLPAGQAWSASASGPTGSPAVSLLTVEERRGQGIRLAGKSPSVALRSGIKAARDYLYAHAADLVGTCNPKAHKLLVEVHPLEGATPEGPCGVGLLLACCSALLRKQLRGGLIVAGEFVGDAIKPIKQPVDFVEAAVAEDARAILMPVSSRQALRDVSDEIATRIEMLFYASASDALKKALQE